MADGEMDMTLYIILLSLKLVDIDFIYVGKCTSIGSSLSGTVVRSC